MASSDRRLVLLAPDGNCLVVAQALLLFESAGSDDLVTGSEDCKARLWTVVRSS